MLSLLAVVARGGEWPDDYAELDSLLCAQSAKYRAMAEAVRKRQPYRVVPADEFPLGNVREDGGTLVIELNPAVPRHRRATVLVWEMANASQRATFAEVTRRAVAGEIASAREYGLRMELVEHGSHQLHRDVLEELACSGIEVGEDFLYFLDPRLKSLDEYRIPSAHTYVEAQARSGHTRHYEEWYYRVTGKTPPTSRDR
jgi:hypothetical protein